MILYRVRLPILRILITEAAVEYPDGTKGGEWHDGKGIGIGKHGSYTNPDLRLSWSKVEKRLRELIKANRYLNPKEKDHYADYLESVSAPQYEVDAQRKMARQRFIDAHRDLPPTDKRDTLAMRLSDFICDLDGYEKDLLSNVERSDLADVTAEQMEQHLSDPATVQQLLDFLAQIQWKTTSVFSRSNAWKFSEELRELHPLCYLYNEGDVVYIGADKYEIADFDENAVSLRNAEFPLFGREYSREDFEEKLKENPANDHLKVVVTEKQQAETPSEKKPDRIQFSKQHGRRLIPERVLCLRSFGCCILKEVCGKPLNIIIAADIHERVVAMAFLHINEVKDFDLIALLLQQMTGIPEQFTLWVKHNKRSIRIHNVGLGVEACFTCTGTAAYKYIQISAVLSSVQADGDILRQQLVFRLILVGIFLVDRTSRAPFS